MKNSLILFACVLVLTLSCSKKSSPPPSDVHLTTGLLVYLPFTGNIADSSGNGNTVTAVSGAALVSDQKGNVNSAFGGTGAGQRMLVSNNGSIHFDTALTISMDVMLNQIQQQLFVGMVDNTTGKGVSFGFGMSLPGLDNLYFSTTDSLATCGVYATLTNAFDDTTQFIPQVGTWYNMIANYHKGNYTIYINGKVISTYKVSETIVPICPTAKLVVGGWWDSDPQSINGRLDNVRLYNRVLNADEIAALSKNFQ
jgi:Concanavalin A-like lectin/glucanases superfamily